MLIKQNAKYCDTYVRYDDVQCPNCHTWIAVTYEYNELINMFENLDDIKENNDHIIGIDIEDATHAYDMCAKCKFIFVIDWSHKDREELLQIYDYLYPDYEADIHPDEIVDFDTLKQFMDSFKVIKEHKSSY